MRYLGLVSIPMLLGLAGCAEDAVRQDAMKKAVDGQYESALHVLDEGEKQFPESAVIQSASIRVRDDAIAKLLAQAGELRSAGRLDEADVALQRAKGLGANGSRIDQLRAQIEVDRRQAAAITAANAAQAAGSTDVALRIVVQALKDNPRHAGLLELKSRLEAADRAARATQGALALGEARPVSLDFRDAPLRAVLDVVSRSSGINFVLDKDLRQDAKVTVYLNKARVEDALDLIVGTNQLAKKVIDTHTVLIYPNTPEKQRDYQEQVVRVFYLSNADAKGAASFLKQMLKLRDPFVDDRTNMLALRDTADNIQLAERLLALYDSPEPEVLLELQVLEISTKRLTELGIDFPSSISLTPNAPGSASSLTLGNVKSMSLNDITLGLGSLTVNLKRETGDYSTLANPKIRVKNKEKAHVLIGDKIPVITTTTSSTGFASDSVSYVDVGLKLDIEPVIYPDDGVSMKVALEVSSLGTSTTTSSGSVVYQIGTRDASTYLRLQDGETQLLAGLISRDEQNSASKIPGLGDLPVLGRLFSSQTDNGTRDEIVLAITPHILRNVVQPPASEAEIWVGTESAPRLKGVGGQARYAAVPGAATPAPAASVPAGAGSQSGPAAALANGADPAPTANAPPQLLRSGVLAWKGPGEVKVGETFDAQVRLTGAVALMGLPIEVQFDPGIVELAGVDEGAYFKAGGAPTSFTKSGDGRNGSIRMGVARGGEPAAAGEGSVYTLHFKATHPGEVWVNIVSAQPQAVSPQFAPSLPPALHVVVH